MAIYQVLDALDYGDAVSNYVIEISKMLNELNIENKIYSLYVHNKVVQLYNPINQMKIGKNDIILYHFSGKSNIIDQVLSSKCKKALIYHNITPHHFFEGMEPHYHHCLEGREQLANLSGKFDYYIGDSEFNTHELEQMGCSPTMVMPIVVDLPVRAKRKIYSSKSKKKFIFIGRVAPNKKHEDVIKIFDYYYSYINPDSELFLIGNFQDYMPYYNKLKNIITNLPSRDNIHFTGKVSNEELDYHYKTADVFLCMSEHEGFCVPLLESMSYGVITIAYDSGAIRTTMGDSGVLILEKLHEDIAELISFILEHEQLAQSIIDNQYKWLINFSRENSRQRLLSIINKMRVER